MQPSAILESALYADDLDAAQDFYGRILGLECIAKLPGRHVFFRCGVGVLLIFNPRETEQPLPPEANLPVPPHGARGPGHLCFAATADELEAWKERLVEHGVSVETEIRWPAKKGEANGGRSIYFRDPAGNSLEMAEPRIWGL